MIARLPDWRMRLGAYVAEATAKEFALGAHDCGGFALGAVAAWSGEDVAAAAEINWSNENDVNGLVQKHGTLERLADAVAARIGLAPVAFTAARDGDVAFCRIAAPGAPSRDLLGVIWRALGADALGVGFRGLIRLPKASIVKCWGLV
jgi:uncharacterized protein DUF6950